MIGARAFIAMSWILMIFCAWVSDSEPPNTVKSLAKTNTVRPFTVPQPVTTPSPGIFVLSMPKSVARCSTNMSNSSNEPLSISSSDALARGELAALVLGLDARLAAADPRAGATAFELFADVFHECPLRPALPRIAWRRAPRNGGTKSPA